MNFWVHLAIAVVLMAYFAFRFYKDRRTYQMLFIIWIPSTLLTYLWNNSVYRICLAAFQAVMFVLVLVFMFKKPKAATEQPKEIACNKPARRPKKSLAGNRPAVKWSPMRTLPPNRCRSIAA